jgi:hypothetical protein
MKAKLPVLLLLCAALAPAISACGDNTTIGAPTPTANAAQAASVTPVTQPGAGLGATAEAGMLTAVVNPTPILTPAPDVTATPSPTPTRTP